MNVNFSVELRGLEQGEQETLAKSKRALFLGMSKMHEIAIMRCPADTGDLRNSIWLHPDWPGEVEYLLTVGLDYGIHVEYGTSPHFVPISPLKSWSRRVLGDEKAAYAVRAAISKRGTPAQPFLRPAFDEVVNIHMKKYLK